ncbi:hypothetical protein CF327_g341 [Tilletia walkeri]|nr:hypothetical protein CF327_g341 [Tilletia walkeri]
MPSESSGSKSKKSSSSSSSSSKKNSSTAPASSSSSSKKGSKKRKLTPSEAQIYQFITQNGVATQLAIDSQFQDVSLEDRIQAINGLARLSLIRLQTVGGELQYEAASRQEASVMSDLEGNDLLVYTHIRDSGNEGIWTKTIKVRANLHQTVVNRCLKSLEQKHLIKTVKNVKFPTRKIVMLYNLEPSSELSGGPWYSDTELDEAFIEAISNVCLRFIQEKTWPDGGRKRLLYPASHVFNLPTAQQILDHAHSTKAFGVTLSIDNMNQLLDTLIYDEKIEKVPILPGQRPSASTSASGSRSRSSGKSKKSSSSSKKRKRKSSSRSDSESEDGSEDESDRDNSMSEDEDGDEDDDGGGKGKGKSSNGSSSHKRSKRKHRASSRSSSRSRSSSGSKRKRSRRSYDSGSDSEEGSESDRSEGSESSSASDSRRRSGSKKRKRSSSSSRSSHKRSSSRKKKRRRRHSSSSSNSDDDSGSGSESSGSSSDSSTNSGPIVSDDEDEDGTYGADALSEAFPFVFRALRPIHVFSPFQTDLVRGGVDFGTGTADSSWMQTPCGQCPIFRFCEPGGPVSAEGCQYFDQWIEAGLEGNKVDEGGEGDEEVDQLEGDDDDDEEEEKKPAKKGLYVPSVKGEEQGQVMIH